MPLQNRIDPFGDIHAVAARGMFTGNRGVIHDPMTCSLLKRRWTTKAWIICLWEFRDRRRQVMGRNSPSGHAGWTELFFLDEVTALAIAGMLLIAGAGLSATLLRSRNPRLARIDDSPNTV